MTNNYYIHQFKLSDHQNKNIIHAIQNKEPIALRLSKDCFINGVIPLPLTKTDARKVINNQGFIYDLNKTKLKMLDVEKDKDKEGGFIPILPLIGALLGLGTLGATVAKTVIDKKSNDSKLEEEQRHNKTLEKLASGSALTLRPWKEGTSIDVKNFISKSSLDEIGQKTFRSFMKNLYDNFHINYEGEALTLRRFVD